MAVTSVRQASSESLETQLANDTWRLYPLHFGDLAEFEKSLFLLHKGFGEKIEAPYTGWLLDNGEEKVLVDTGPWDPVKTKKYHHYEATDTGPDAVDKALGDYEMTPATVTTVLLTHLHWDHVANVSLFTNATFYVQRSEVHYALDPLPMHRVPYEVGLGFQPPWQSILHRIVLLEGDTEVAPGITCCLLPGHTPGSQGILVDTTEGKYLIAGDNVDLRENWEGDEQLKHRPGGIFTNLENYWKSLERMEELADVVLPSHDYSVFDKDVYP
jgi:N-acyl homoserine lactone hydrolase